MAGSSPSAWGMPPLPPVLSISNPGSNQVTLSWQDTNDWLQSVNSLNPGLPSQAGFGAPPISPWTNVLMAPATTVTLPANQAAQFFRLIVSPGGPPPTELWLQSLSDTNSDYYFELAWDAVPGAASYNVYMANVPQVSSGNYASLPGGMAFKGITGVYTDIPNVPGGVFNPVLAVATNYYFVVTAVSADGLESAESPVQFGMVGPTASLEGVVYANLTLDGNPTTVNLPNVSLTLVNQNNPAFSNTITSDVSGMFTFPALPQGTYNLCWSANGFTAGCSNSITLGPSGDTIALQLTQARGTALLYGFVNFQDGTPVYNVDSVFNINVQPTVYLTNNQTLVSKAMMNSASEYVMPGVPENANLQVGVTVGGTTVVSNVSTFAGGPLAAQPNSAAGSVTIEQDLIVPDTPPVIQSLIAYSNGVPVYIVPPGITVQVIATATGNNLTYQWFDTNGLTSYPNSSNISWTLPANASGFQYLWLQVSDGSGGYAVARLELDVDPSAFFDGTVIGSDTGLPVTNATVTVNGQQATTDSNGFFSFQLTAASQYALRISASGYVPESALYFEPQNDQTYLLTATTPMGPFCPDGDNLVWVTNDANGIVAGIPGDGLVDSNDAPYNSCFYVSLTAEDPCNWNYGFAGADFDTNDDALTAYSIVDVCVTDESGNRLDLAEGASADIYAPVATDCIDTNAALPDIAECYDETNVPTLSTFTEPFWNAVNGATLVYDSVNGIILTNYYAVSAKLGTLLFGAPGCTGPNAVKYNFAIQVDSSLRLPLTLGFFQDNGKNPSAPDPQRQILQYTDITDPGQAVQLTLCPGQVVWFEVLSLRQSPGQYYVPGTGMPLMPSKKDVIQALRYVAPATPPAKPATVTLGLGATVDVPRSAQILKLTAKSLDADTFLTVRSGTLADANTYYSKVDPGNVKTNFASWQASNSSKGKLWSGIGSNANLNALNGYGIYFNANDLGAGRRTGMNLFTDADGKESVAYYVATYFSLAKAAADEKAGGQASPTNNLLKYIVCMEYSLPLKGTNILGSRYMKFFAFDATGKRTGEVPNEANQPAYVPFLCMNCHGAGPSENATATPNGNVNGQFVPFDVANYTFSSAYPPTQAPNSTAFSRLNAGLTTADTSMPLKTLLPLINYLVANGNYTTGTSFYNTLRTWPAELNNATAQETSLYNNVYAISCRSCHVTQPESGYNWLTASGYSSSFSDVIAAPNNDLTGTGFTLMPHAQRTFGVFWGSATALQLQTTGIITTTPAVISQPMVGREVNNSDWFVAP